MIEKHFSNKLYENAIRKVEDDRDFYIRDAIEKADFDTIIRASDISYVEALVDSDFSNMLEAFFKEQLVRMESKYVKDGDYDFINKATIVFTDYHEASDFLTCCKLFIKVSSDYKLMVNNGTYTFTFNKDRLDDDFI